MATVLVDLRRSFGRSPQSSSFLRLSAGFTDPDGRATWEWVEIDGDVGVRWRRVGSHAIFRNP